MPVVLAAAKLTPEANMLLFILFVLAIVPVPIENIIRRLECWRAYP